MPTSESGRVTFPEGFSFGRGNRLILTELSSPPLTLLHCDPSQTVIPGGAVGPACCRRCMANQSLCTQLRVTADSAFAEAILRPRPSQTTRGEQAFSRDRMHSPHRPVDRRTRRQKLYYVSTAPARTSPANGSGFYGETVRPAPAPAGPVPSNGPILLDSSYSFMRPPSDRSICAFIYPCLPIHSEILRFY